MRKMTDEEVVMYNILKNDRVCRNNNYEAVRSFYLKVYGIQLPKIDHDMPSIWTIERMIRTLKSTYPSVLTDPEERQIKQQKVSEFKEKALDENKPIKPTEEKQVQGNLGLFGETWW